jgi:hypothetical protein
MATKRRCPSCGAKNEMSVRRCRVCTAVINADAPESGKPVEAPAAAPAVDDLFDAGVIDRQLQPTRTKFGGGSGALAARLAAANGGEIPASYVLPSSAPADGPHAAPVASAPPPSPAPSVAWNDVPFEPIVASEVAPPGPPTAPPIEYEAEPFDPEALFRDRD